MTGNVLWIVLKFLHCAWKLLIINTKMSWYFSNDWRLCFVYCFCYCCCCMFVCAHMLKLCFWVCPAFHKNLIILKIIQMLFSFRSSKECNTYGYCFSSSSMKVSVCLWNTHSKWYSNKSNRNLNEIESTEATMVKLSSKLVCSDSSLL